MDSTESRDLLVEQILSEDAHPGPEDPQVILASSAAALTEAMYDIGVLDQRYRTVEVPDWGDTAYLAACRGIMGSPGYSVVVESATLEGDQVRVHLALLGEMEPELVATFPFAVARIWDMDPKEKNFSFEIVEHLEDTFWRQQVVN